VSPTGEHAAAIRSAVALLAGVVVAIIAVVADELRFALAGWIAAAALYATWTCFVVWGKDWQETKLHAKQEDRGSDWIVLTASVASIAGVGVQLLADRRGIGPAVVGVASVVAAWVVVHTVFTLRYADLYYSDEAGEGDIDFNQAEPPCYLDFAYLAFTVGMTYQVSDTNLKTRAIRRAALQHALVSYLLGAVILAVTVNLLAGLNGTS
jgi:uncharacterized membrane protein